jgi:hypothetical protein
LIEPSKIDIKGLAIRKTNVNKKISKAFTQIIADNIIYSEEIDLAEILRKLKLIENEIRDSFTRGEITFATPVKVNHPDSYKFPVRMAGLRASLVWNYVYPEQTIKFPTSINMVKTTIIERPDMMDLQQKNPKVFNILNEKIFGNDVLKEYGIQYIGFPKNVKKIPDWIIDYIDIDSIIADCMKPFLVVLNSLGLKTLKLKANEEFYSNILQF